MIGQKKGKSGMSGTAVIKLPPFGMATSNQEENVLIPPPQLHT
jgi:hypothetical protein